MKNIRTTLSLMLISTFAAPCAFAQYASDSDAEPHSAAWYMGAEVGRSKAKIDDQAITNALITDGATSTSINNDTRGTGFRIFGGYQFNDYVALEGGYVDLGKFGYTATTNPAGTVNGIIRLKGLDLGVIGFLPFTDKLYGFGRVGMNYTQAHDHFSSTGLVDTINPNPAKSDLNYNFGLGLEYRMTQALALRLEAQRYRVNDAIGNRGDIDLVSVGMLYRFGEKTQMHAAPAPVAPPVVAAPVVQEVAPVPVYVPPPPPPKPVKVSFSADSLFEFNKSDIKAQGRGAIDTFASELKDTDYRMITVSGHTDRIGTHKYNLDLSMRRAETVKNYLIETAGVPASKIEARGLDGDDPVTKPDDCKGNKVTKALIACLQPDRRVDLEVSGTEKTAH